MGAKTVLGLKAIADVDDFLVAGETLLKKLSPSSPDGPAAQIKDVVGAAMSQISDIVED